MTREQVWDGAVNTRDLGGLPAGSGQIQPGRVYRSARPDGLSDLGRRQLAEAGIRTVVDLRNDAERLEVRIIDAVAQHHHPIEDPHDEVFMAEWGLRLDSPAYYGDVLRRWPGLVTGVFARIADAPVGGVLVHCKAGCDRTGMIVAMLLSVAGTPVDCIVDDYELAVRTMNTYYQQDPGAGEAGRSAEALEKHCATARAELVAFLSSVDVPAFLASNGLTHDQLTRLRNRMLLPMS